MDFGFSEEQQALRELARKIFDAEARPDRLREVEQSEERIDRALWKTLADANLLGGAIAEEYGGSGFGFFELCALLEEVGRAVAPVPALATLAGGALAIEGGGSDAQKRQWLPRIARGEVFLPVAFEEPAHGDAAAPACRARRDGGAWRLDGEKHCVPAAHVAERIVVPARVEEGSRPGVGLFLVDPHASGVALERQEATDRTVQGALALDGARVDAEGALEGGAGGVDTLPRLVEQATVAACAVQLGVAERALRIAADYAAERQQFDRPIGSFQAVHQRAADAYVDLETLRLTTWRAAFLIARGEPAGEAAAIAKYFAGVAGHGVTFAAMHLHGGIGVDVDYPVHRYYLWSRQLELSLGPAAQHLAALGDRLAA